MKVNIIQPLKVKNCIISHQINSQRITELSERERSKYNTIQSQEEKKITINPKKAKECLFNKKHNFPSLKLVQLSPENLPKVKQTSLIFIKNEEEKEDNNSNFLNNLNNINYNSNFEPRSFKPVKKTISVADLIHMIKEKLNRKEHVDHLIGQFKSLQGEITEISQENKKSRNLNRESRALTENLSALSKNMTKNYITSSSTLHAQPHFLKNFTKSNIVSSSNSASKNKKFTKIIVKNNNDQMYQLKKYPKLCLISNEALADLKSQKYIRNSKTLKDPNSNKTFCSSQTINQSYQLVNSKITLPIMGRTQHSSMKKLYVKTNKNDLNLNSEFYNQLNAKAITSSKFGSTLSSLNLYNTMDPCGSLYNEIKNKSKEVIQTNMKLQHKIFVD
jgi:hypothetical protein